MFQKFFENTMETQFIKNILANASVPNIPTVNSHDYIIHTMKYIYDTNVIECLKSGYVEKLPGMADDAPIAEYRVIQGFIFGERYPKFTEKYISNTAFYDSDTHYHLGNFLRCLRDTSYIDLMPFYNCFNYKVISGSITQSPFKKDKGNYYYNPKTSQNYKVFATPIRFNKTYTIAIDAYANTFMTPILFSEQGELKDGAGKPFFKVKAKKYSRLDFLHPITFSVSPSENESDSDYAFEEFLGHYEKYLYLLIQLPVNIDTSIVVLEGDYTHASDNKIINAETSDPVDLNNALIANPSLLLINDGNIYAYSNRLIEHLLLNPISSSDDIWQNVTRVQYMANMTRARGFLPHAWTDNMRIEFFKKYLSDDYHEHGTLKLDVNGFVNHNVEKMLLRGMDK